MKHVDRTVILSNSRYSIISSTECSILNALLPTTFDNSLKMAKRQVRPCFHWHYKSLTNETAPSPLNSSNSSSPRQIPLLQRAQ